MKITPRTFGLALALSVAACAGTNGIDAVPAGRISQTCRVAIPNADKVVDAFQDRRAATMEVGNDSGWCGWYDRLVETEGSDLPWISAQVSRAPAHGVVRVRQDADRVHVEYQPAPGYVGPDAFAVRLGPGYALRSAAVNVVPATPPSSGPQSPEAGVTSSVLQNDSFIEVR